MFVLVRIVQSFVRGEWMVAFCQIKVPIFTVIVRRSFGVAGNNYATPLDRPSMRVVWPAADTGGRLHNSYITSKVNSRLAFANPVEGFDPGRIKVITAHGTVYLMGTVSRAEGSGREGKMSCSARRPR